MRHLDLPRREIHPCKAYYHHPAKEASFVNAEAIHDPIHVLNGASAVVNDARPPDAEDTQDTGSAPMKKDMGTGAWVGFAALLLTFIGLLSQMLISMSNEHTAVALLQYRTSQLEGMAAQVPEINMKLTRMEAKQDTILRVFDASVKNARP